MIVNFSFFTAYKNGNLFTLTKLSYIGSISNDSNQLEQFRIRVGTGTAPWHRFLPHDNLDHCYWVGFTTKNPAYQLYNYGSN